MIRRPLRIATTEQLEHSVRVAGFDTFLLPKVPSLDFNRSLEERLSDGEIYRPFLEKHDVELVLDFNTSALTFVRLPGENGRFQLTTAALGIPHVTCYQDPITATMKQVPWPAHWQILESRDWVKWVWETAHAEELMKMGIPNVIALPMAAADKEYDRSPLSTPSGGPAVAFMGHPASTWFRSADKVSPAGLLSGLTAAAVRADMPDLPFHKIYFDLYGFGKPPSPSEDAQVRSASAHKYYNEKFVFNAYLAVKQRDRFARFLKHKLGDQFELIGDHWQEAYDLAHTPRIWNMGVLHDRMRRVPICLNLMKGNNEGGLNVRHFEITATGGFMLTYHSAELSHCFDAGRECAEFRNEDELLQRIGYFLDHPQERREIAAAGQERTLSRHLYSHRINQLVRILANNDCLPTRRDTQRSLKGIKDDQPHVEPIPKIRVRGVTDQDCVVTPIGQSALRS